MQRADCACMPKTDIVVSQHETSLSTRPEFYRLPKAISREQRGKGKAWERDPFFGFSRTFYYEGEARGYWKLVRIRERGKLRGVTLVPYDAVAAFVRSQMEGA
jgi:hypothetical protein